MSDEQENLISGEFNDQVLDLELDYKERGGLQRYKRVGDFVDWLTEEENFWAWLGQNPASQTFAQTNLSRSFNYYSVECRNLLGSATIEWTRIIDRVEELLGIPKEEIGESCAQDLDTCNQEGQKLIENLRKNLVNTMNNRVIVTKNHISRHEPEAHFVDTISESDAIAAVYALEYLVRENTNSAEVSSSKGHILGALFRQGLAESAPVIEKAFQESIQSWASELQSYKETYESLKVDYASLKTNNRQTAKRWELKTVEMSEQFKVQLESNQQDLSNLKETFESHMVLKGPMQYWRTKRKMHDAQINRLRRSLIMWSIVGAVVLFGAAFLLLPEFQPAKEIPWRQIGFFALSSTFVLWFIRLLVKLLLSNIHLSADAREREVMIQTFMALMRNKESREGVTKEEIALVLAPIFKPSTTGVIKDDGGPVTLTDFITRMSGK